MPHGLLNEQASQTKITYTFVADIPEVLVARQIEWQGRETPQMVLQKSHRLTFDWALICARRNGFQSGASIGSMERMSVPGG